MAQLSLFPRSQVASWRDPTASRNYSPAGEQFRREHARHREWGLRQRHGRKAMYLRIYGDTAAPSDRVGDGLVSGPAAPAFGAAVLERLPADRAAPPSRPGSPIRTERPSGSAAPDRILGRVATDVDAPGRRRFGAGQPPVRKWGRTLPERDASAI
jgi:hypothetical protein